MARFTLDQSFDTGLPKIDQQHRQLVALINDLDEAVEKGTAKAMIGGVLQELIRYVGNHFTDEEALMMRHNFPGLPMHCQEHDFYVTRLSQIQEGLLDGEDLGRNTLDFLLDWLSSHIKGTDMVYAAFIREQTGYNKD
ncbi:bacteriohemerythrin [Geobacter sp. SVR]|uniref:bacteriohemerythrin n=1 Tax=Geobacter sp. SVR TaxID=2495594 RepID=UPI00143F0261|nr:bacteriohemerythrin [Geobacter sp. SVR]BCS52368.1 hemerythrin [Geobacter sp. SVR]GCF84973.1 hemerythrin [Geobacter sp. SVR]